MCWRASHSVTHKHELWIWFTVPYAMMKALLRLARHETGRGVERWHCTLYCLEFCTVFFYDAKRQHLSTIKTDSDLSFTTKQQQIYCRKQLLDQADDNLRTELLTKRIQVRFREIVNTCSAMHRKASRKTHSTNGVNIESRVKADLHWRTTKHTRAQSWFVLF